MKIKFYGRLGEVLGREVDVETPAGTCTVSDLKLTLARAHPHSAADLIQASLRACVGDTIVDDDFSLLGIQTVEFFPPLSGG